MLQSKKRIILIGSIPPPYHGSSIYFSNLLNSKIKDEFDVAHIDISDHRNLDNLSKLDFTNVKIALKNIYSLYKMLGNFEPEMVYIPVASNFLPYLRDGLFILTSAYFSKAKIVIHLHEGGYFRDGFYNNSNFIVKHFIRKSLSKVDTAIVLGDRLKFIFKGLVKNIVAVPNGIESNSNAKPNKKIEHPNDKIIIGFLGNLFESKGLLDLLYAAVIVIKKFSNIEFQFAGAWSEKERKTKEKAEHIIDSNNIKGKVKFFGVVTGNDKEYFLNRIDMLIFPTWYKYEGFGIVIIEAMSAGVPVVSSKDIATIPDIVLDGETGILVEIKNPVMLADAIIKLIENPAMRKEMGMKGKQRYENFFTLDINIQRMIDVFNAVLN